MRARTPEALGALREREFRLLFTGQAFSLLGDGMVAVALSFAVLDLTGSVSDLGYVFAARLVPLVVFLLAGGVLADRLPRRAVMLAADVTRLASQGVMAALLISGRAQLWELVVTQAFHGAATAFFNPASTGLMPAVVSAGRLQQANALRGMSMASGRVAGPALAGVLVALAGPGWAIAADAASFGVSAFFLTRLRLPAHERVPVKPFLRDLHEGWREVVTRKWLWSILLFAGVANMSSTAFMILGPFVAKASLGGAGAWALIVSALGAGSVVGGLAALQLRPRRPLEASIATFLFFGLPPVMLALRLPAVAVAAGALVAGLGTGFGNPLWETVLQQNIPRRALSRVSAYDWLVSIALAPVGQVLVGPISSAIGIDATLWASAAIFVSGVLVTLSVREVRELRGAGEVTPQVEDQVVDRVGQH